MQRNILEMWQKIDAVYIPPLDIEGFAENVLKRDIWSKPSQTKHRPHVSRASEYKSGEDKTTLLSNEDETTLILNEEGFPDGEDLTVILPIPEPEEHAYLVRSNTNERIDLSMERFIIGKSSKVDYQIQGNNAISRAHISITKTDVGYEMEDLDSSNHTYIDDQEITEPVLLEEGQVFKMADEEFSFHIERKNT